MSKYMARWLLFLLIGAGPEGAAAQSDSLLAFFPQQQIIPSFIADGTARRFSFGREFQANHFQAKVGGLFPLLETRAVGERTQVCVGASVSTTLHPQQSLAVLSTEFYVDYFLVDVEWTHSIFSRFGMGHTSHHLGDSSPTGQQAIDYSRDYAQLFLGYKDSVSRVYGGLNYGYDFVIAHPVTKPLLLEVGAERILLKPGVGLQVYGAFDLKFRQESGFGSTQRFQVGVQFQNGTSRLFRFALTQQSGLEERGQFSGQHAFVTTLAFAMEF